MPIVKNDCEKIQCGATTQLEAGMQAIMDCSSAGYSLSRSCLDPICVGPLRPQYCSPNATVDVNIPYSPANSPFSPIDETSTPMVAKQPLRAYETKRRRNYYQDQVECPGSETNPFWIGMDHWKSLDSVMNVIPVMGDLGLAELAGFLVPALGISWLGYLYLNGRLFK